MPFIPNKISWKSRRAVLICALLLPTTIALAAFGFGRVKINRTPPAKSLLPEPSASMTFQGNPASSRNDSAHITLRRTGFEPREVSLPDGRFLLAVDNVTGMGEMSYRLLTANGIRIRDFPAKGRYRLRKVLDLRPGRYALVVTNQPEWICRITIAAP